MDVKTSSGCIGLADILLVTFIVLKLTHVVEWPWVWVLSPMWIPISVLAVLCVVLLCIKLYRSAKTTRLALGKE